MISKHSIRILLVAIMFGLMSNSFCYALSKPSGTIYKDGTLKYLCSYLEGSTNGSVSGSHILQSCGNGSYRLDCNAGNVRVEDMFIVNAFPTLTEPTQVWLQADLQYGSAKTHKVCALGAYVSGGLTASMQLTGNRIPLSGGIGDYCAVEIPASQAGFLNNTDLSTRAFISGRPGGSIHCSLEVSIPTPSTATTDNEATNKSAGSLNN